MKKNELIAIILMIASTIGIVGGFFIVEKYRVSKYFTVELTAREPANGNWYPKVIKVPYGKEVKIFIRNIETVSHGFAIPDFKVAINEIKAGHVAVATFTPDKRGTFPFMCTVWCSKRHMEMNGKIIVE